MLLYVPHMWYVVDMAWYLTCHKPTYRLVYINGVSQQGALRASSHEESFWWKYLGQIDQVLDIEKCMGEDSRKLVSPHRIGHHL